MDFINYFKFDLRLIKESLKYNLIITTLFCIYMFSINGYNFAISNFFFNLVVLAAIPFGMQGNEKSTEMYYMFPAKISNMVFGRFLYLICVTCIIFLINGAIIAYLYKIHEFDNLKIIVMFLSGIMCLIICFIQYPIYYKLELEKAKAIARLIYFVPAFIIFALPSFLISSKSFIVENFKSSLDFILNNEITLILFTSLILMFIGYISYLISCRICASKDV